MPNNSPSPAVQQFLAALQAGATGSTAPSPGGVGSLVSGAAAASKAPTAFDRWLQQFAEVAPSANGDLSSGAVYLGAHRVPTSGHLGVAQYRNEDGTETKVPTLPTPAHDNSKVTSVTAALNIPATWSHDEQLAAMQKMRDYGFSVTNYDDMMKVWSAAVQRSADALSASNGKNKITPWDALALYGEENNAQSHTPGSANFTGTKTQVSKSVNELTEGQTWAALRGTLQSLLGRDPSDQELRNFTYKMNSLAAANPSITKTTTQYQDGSPVSQSSTNTGGFTTDDAARSAYDQAEQSPEYGAFQAATTYYNAALSALGAVGNVGTL